MSTARLEIVVGSSGVIVADKALKQLTATAKETEKQQQRMAAIVAEVAAAEEKAAARAVAASEKSSQAAEKQAQRAIAAEEKRVAAATRQAAREAEAWNDAKQKALARYEKQAEAAERAAKKQVAATEKAVARENELWNNAIQRAKAGLDGVLPIRPSLQRIEAQLMSAKSVPSVSAADNPLGALGGSLTSILPQLALATTAVMGLRKVVSETSEYDSLIARLQGVAGSTEAARVQFDKLEALSDETMFSENQVADAFIKLDQVGLKPTERTMRSLTNIASATGTSLEQLADVSVAVAAGSYRGLRQFGIRAEESSAGLKLTFRGVTTEIARSAEAVENYLVNLGETDFAGAASRQLDTMGGAVKKLEDAWGDLFREVGRSAVGEFIATGMKEAANAINLATSAFEALLYTASQRPKFTGMSPQLAEFVKGATKWGAAKSDEELALENRVQAAIEQIEKGRMSPADKALREYLDRKAALEDALTQGVAGDIGAALDENKRQYEASVNSAKQQKPSSEVVLFDAQTEALMSYERRKQEQEERAKIAQAQQVENVRKELAKQEDAERASYENRKAVLAKYLGPDSEELWNRNSELWQQHIDAIAEKEASKRTDLQKRLADIGAGPQSQMQVVQTKYAGQRVDLGNLLESDLSSSNEARKLEAEQTYSEKSIAIERERAREIAAIQLELVGQSVQNAEAMFGGLTTALKNSQGEQSAAYQTMFAIQKSFGVAAAEVAMFQAMAEASKQPFPANIPLYIKAAAQGAQLIAQISSLSYSGAYDSGGDVPARSRGIAGERGVEVVGPAGVLGREQTAALFGGSSGRNIRIINAYDGEAAVSGFLGSTRGDQVLVNWVKRNGPLIRSVTGA